MRWGLDAGAELLEKVLTSVHSVENHGGDLRCGG